MSSNAISTSSYEQLYKESADDPDNKKKNEAISLICRCNLHLLSKIAQNHKKLQRTNTLGY